MKALKQQASTRIEQAKSVIKSINGLVDELKRTNGKQKQPASQPANEKSIIT